MEKADILEMTVRHLRQLQRQQFSGRFHLCITYHIHVYIYKKKKAFTTLICHLFISFLALSASDPAIINKYRLGFNECANEVSKYLTNMDGLNTEFRARLLNHLANVTVNIEQPEVTRETQSQSPPITGTPYAPSKSPPVSRSSYAPYPKFNSNNANVLQPNSGQVLKVNGNTISMPTNVSTEVLHNVQNLEKLGNITPHKSENAKCSENTPSKMVHGVQTFSSQMPSGEVAFIIPAANMVQYGTIPNYVIPVLQPQSTIQISSQSSSNVIQAQQTVPIAYSAATSHSVVPSVFPNTTFVNSSLNTLNLPISLVSSGNGTIAVQREQSPQFAAFPVNNVNVLSNQIQKINFPSENNSYKTNVEEGSSFGQRGIVSPVESHLIDEQNEKVDPMWRPW